jgi:hypothetical protein
VLYVFTLEEFHLTKADESTSYLIPAQTESMGQTESRNQCALHEVPSWRWLHFPTMHPTAQPNLLIPFSLSLNRRGTWEQGIWEEARVLSASREASLCRRRRTPHGGLRQGASNGHEEARRVAGSASPPTTSAMRPVAGGSAMTPPTSTWRRVAGSVAPGRRRIRHLAADNRES